MGTLVEILDIQPGSAFPWVHVRIGQAEGYMSGELRGVSNRITRSPASV